MGGKKQESATLEIAQGLKEYGETLLSIWGVVQSFLASTEPKSQTYFLLHEYFST